MKKVILFILSILIFAALIPGCNTQNTDSDKLTIISTVFPGYDFARQITGDKAEVSILLPAGSESHHFEPTPKDIVKIQNCDLFIYTGGENDAWVEEIISSLDTAPVTVKMLDVAEMPTDDEHVWTSPLYAGKISQLIKDALCKIDPENETFYSENYNTYSAELLKLDESFRDFFETYKPIMVFGDRFPLKHFAEAYDITYYSAFEGCSAETEPSAAELANIIKVVKTQNIDTIFCIEFSNRKVAKSISEATGAEIRQFHTCHNVTQEELNNGATYISLMEENLRVLKEVF